MALGELLWRNGRRYGGYTVHFGVVVIIVALAISGSWKTEREETLRAGESLTIGDYTVRFEEVWGREEPQRFVVGSTFSITAEGKPAGSLRPSMNYYPRSDQPIATPAVKSSLKEDLYLTLMAFDRDEGAHATVRAIVNPAVPWLWIGGFIVALGSMVAIRPSGARKKKVAVTAGRPEAGEPSRPEAPPSRPEREREPAAVP